MSEFNDFLKTQRDIHAGNAILETAHAACKAALDANCPLVFSGGIGHSTTLLVESVRAENLLPEEKLVLETRSTDLAP